MTVHILPARVDARRPCHLLLTPMAIPSLRLEAFIMYLKT